MTPLQRIVIAGGGTAGWMSAAALSHVLGAACHIELVESDEIGTIGVGEASIPHLTRFNNGLGIDENEFLRETGGSFKLGIEFVDWGGLGQRYIHGFGQLAPDDGALPFHHLWLRGRQLGVAGPLEAYSLNTAAAQAHKFMRARPDMAGSPLAEVAHAYHFDAGLYARFLRRFAEARGVRRTEGRIVRVAQTPQGDIEALHLADGQRIAGDLFIDCSGLRGLLIEQTLRAGFEDWGHWLPCDRALAVPSARTEPLLPYTRSTARVAGWQWRIPLQHRTGNGLVYCSRSLSQDEATALLLANLDGEALADPRPISFTAGRRRQAWVRNCVAVGLSSGFLEPLESTSIHLIQTMLARLITFLPHQGFDATDIATFNALTQQEYESIRDFLILHYKQTARGDSAFWRHCQHMDVPDTLRRKMDLFGSNGRILRERDELFTEMSWLQVMVGQGLLPAGHHPLAAMRPDAQVQAQLADAERVIQRCVQHMPLHADFIRQHCQRPDLPQAA